MKVCPGCLKSTRVSERLEQDRKKNKTWLIHYCAKCGFNHDIEEYSGEYLTPQQELDKHDYPKGKYWPTL